MAADSDKIQIIEPPMFFLDTNHLINIANLRKRKPLPAGQSPEAYSLIDQCIGRHFGVVFLEAAALDWVDGKATEDSAREIAQVLDSAKLLYLFEFDTWVYLREVLDECVRLHRDLRVPQYDIFHLLSDGGSYEPALLKIARCIPNDISESAQASFAAVIESGVTQIPVVSVRQHVIGALLWKKRNPDTYKERVENFKEMLSEDIKGANGYFTDPTRFHTAWLKGFLKADKVLVACNDGLTTEDAADILAHLDLERCPSVWLYIKAHEHRMRAGYPPTDNEGDDWSILPIVPYVDVILIDRGFREFVIRADSSLEAKVFANAADAAKALSALVAPWNGDEN